MSMTEIVKIKVLVSLILLVTIRYKKSCTNCDFLFVSNQTGENPRRELLNSDILGPFHVEQCLEQVSFYLNIISNHISVRGWFVCISLMD